MSDTITAQIGANPITADPVGYCRRHVDKMEGEGWYVTAMVLGVAADRIEAQRMMLDKIASMVSPTSQIGVLIGGRA